MSQFLTQKWSDDMKNNIPKCPACAGPVDYGFLVAESPIRWANQYEGSRFVGLENAITWEPKKPQGIPMTRCSKCQLMITINQIK